MTARRTLIAAVAVASALGGCATFSPDGGMNDVRRLAQERIGTPARALQAPTEAGGRDAAVSALLGRPLTADGAVEVALLNNPGLQARLADLGIAEADLVQAGWLRNPVFAYSNKRNAHVTTIDRAVIVSVASLLTMPLAVEIEQRRFEEAKVALAAEVVATAAAARQAWYRAVAAQEMVAYYAQVKDAAEAGSELARRMAQVGNFSRLAQMREQAFYADATAQLARAELAAVVEREQLARLLGLEAPSFTLPARLPDLPAAPVAQDAALQTAMDRRLDVQVAKLEAEGGAKALGLVRATRFVNVLDVGYTNESETGESRKNGYEIVLELPLFDFGTARVARAEAQYRQALARTAATAVNARSEVRESYAAYRTAYDVARHYRDEVVPLRKRIADETLLRYNGMLIGVFELLADAREQVASVNAAIEATRDYWVADTALQLALAGKSPGAGASARAARPARAAAAAPAGGH